MLRLNMSIAPCSSACSTLGVLGGDLAGFPNGRRLSDDIIDSALRVVLGVLLPDHQAIADTIGDGVDGERRAVQHGVPVRRVPALGFGRGSSLTERRGGPARSTFGPGPRTTRPARSARMRTIGKAVAAAAMAVALLVAGALAFVRSPGETPQVPARTASTSALLVPAVAAGSLDGTIASLQDRLKALPQDWRGYASLGLAYVAQARVTGDPSWYPKAEGVLARSIRINGDDNVEGTLGLGVLDLARHDFASALRAGPPRLGARPVLGRRLRRDRGRAGRAGPIRPRVRRLPDDGGHQARPRLVRTRRLRSRARRRRPRRRARDADGVRRGRDALGLRLVRVPARRAGVRFRRRGVGPRVVPARARPRSVVRAEPRRARQGRVGERR